MRPLSAPAVLVLGHGADGADIAARIFLAQRHLLTLRIGLVLLNWLAGLSRGPDLSLLGGGILRRHGGNACSCQPDRCCGYQSDLSYRLHLPPPSFALVEVGVGFRYRHGASLIATTAKKMLQRIDATAVHSRHLLLEPGEVFVLAPPFGCTLEIVSESPRNILLPTVDAPGLGAEEFERTVFRNAYLSGEFGHLLLLKTDRQQPDDLGADALHL